MSKNNNRIFTEARNINLELETRRLFLKNCMLGMGGMALGSFLSGCNFGSSNSPAELYNSANPLLPHSPHFPGKARSVIYLHMAGAPSQLELFDFKPDLAKLDGQDCPQSLLEGKKFAFIRGVPKMMGPQASFKQYGESGAWISEHLPHFSTVADEVSFLKAMQTDQFNHGPAQLLIHTGSPRLGSPSMGSWATYGLGSENSNLPGFVVLLPAENFLTQEKVFGEVDFYLPFTRAFNAGVKAILCCL
jgi:hypothetical protein